MRVALLLLICALGVSAQEAPFNGPRKVDPGWHALVGATVHVKPGQTIQANVIVRNNIVAAVTTEPPPAGTLGAAQVLGIGRELGSLEKGMSATLILTDGDPLEVATKTLRAFIDGREIDLSNKQTKLAEKYRAKYRQLDDKR